MAIDAFLEFIGHPETSDECVRIRLGGSKPERGVRGIAQAISAHSMLVEIDVTIKLGGRVDVRVPHAGSRYATVQWVSGRLFACHFDSSLSSATLSAAALKGAVVRQNSLGVLSSEAAIESFGMRIQRLRTEKGLTQSDVAEALRVSEPSVSGWELDKVRPKAGRLDELAQLLGIATSRLLDDEHNGNLPVDVVSRCRVQIAAAVGVDADQVKISVEM